MFRMLLVAMSVLLLAWTPARANNPPSTVSSPADLSPLAAEQALAREAQQKYQDEDYAGARKALDALVASPSFALLTDSQRYYALYHLGWLQIQDNDPASHETFKRTSEMTEFASGEDWHLRLRAASIEKDDADALFSLTTIARRWPASLKQVNDRYIVSLVTRADRAPPLRDAQFQLLVALRGAFWQPTNVFVATDLVWLDLVTDLLDQGKVHDAQAAAESIHTPSYIARMLLDRRYDAVTQADPGRFNYRAALDRELAFQQANAKAAPDRLAGVNAVARYLIEVGRSAEALAMLDDALARIKAEAPKRAFKDTTERNWTLEDKASALLHLGRTDEAVAAMKLAATIPESGLPNVDQQLNLIAFYDHIGQPIAALAAARDDDALDMNDHGRQVLAGNRACAAADAGDKATLQTALASMKAHVDDNPGGALDALICAGDYDAAASLFIAELENPRQRSYPLDRYQDDREPPPDVPPLYRAHVRRFLQLFQRPDVKAAAEKYGRRITLGVYPWIM
jgi:hypothetical protein